MTPVSRFRKPEWQHRDASRRAEAVATSRDAELLENLPRLAREDESPEVRRAAIERLEDWAMLAELAAAEPDPDLARDARDRALDFLIRDQSSDTDRARALLKAAGDKGRLRLLREARNPALRRDVLATIIDPVIIAERALKDDDRELREAALSQLDDTAQLERVVKGAKQRDKRLWRRASAMLEERLVAARDPEACARRAADIVESLESMARSGDTDPERRRQLESDWSALPESARSPLDKRFQGASRILANAAAPRPPATPEPGDQPETAAAEEEDEVAETPPQLAELVHEAELLAEQEQPSADAAGDLDKRWRRHWVAGLDDNPEAAALAGRFTAALDRARHKHEQADRQRHEQRTTLDRYVDTLESHLEAGDLHEAREADHQLKTFMRAEGARPSGAQDRRLAAAHRRLRELRDWQHWANNRVRERLCEEVEALPDADLHPDALLEALKRAQKDWRDLEDSEKLSGEKRVYRASGPGLWKRFQAAGKRAFEHAKPFLEKRSELREQKLAEVNSLVERMSALRDDEDTSEPRELAKTLSAGRRALGRLEELPPRDRGPMARRLRGLLDDLGARLEASRESLVRDKEALIAEAEALDADNDLAGAISTAKSIMARWKNLDTLPRGRERKLWTRLRKAIDPVFRKRDDEQAEAREQRALEQEGLESLCAEAERLASLDGAELEQATSELNRLRGQWQQHGQRPRALEQRFRQALDQFRHRLAEHRAARRFQRIRDLFRAARLCRRVEAGDLDEAGARQEWSRLEALPTRDSGPIGERLDKAAKPDTSVIAGNTSTARDQVLAMELIAGVESPAEAAQARMQLKVDRLNRSMRGESARDPEEEMDELLLAWAATGPVDPAESKSLEQRAAAALEAFHGQELEKG